MTERFVCGFAALAVVLAQAPPRIIDSTRASHQVGTTYGNVLTEEQRRGLEERVRLARMATSPLTIQEFVASGGRIDRIDVRSVPDSWPGSFERAQSTLRELLESQLFMNHSEGPFLFLAWSEITGPALEVLLHYDNGRIGRLETDRSHLFVEDRLGVFWWYRWRPAPQPH